MYLDWGLEIKGPDNEELYYSPCALCVDSYGFKPNEKYLSWEEADNAAFDGDVDAFVEWDEPDWKERLESESSDLLEAFCFEHLENLREK
tara:strand:- start:153 stop:422 length:270 start_codon:yes stop_codon:yes gene_type:complete